MAIFNGGFTTATRMRYAKCESRQKKGRRDRPFVAPERQFFDSFPALTSRNRSTEGAWLMAQRRNPRPIATPWSVFEQDLGAAFA